MERALPLRAGRYDRAMFRPLGTRRPVPYPAKDQGMSHQGDQSHGPARPALMFLLVLGCLVTLAGCGGGGSGSGNAPIRHVPGNAGHVRQAHGVPSCTLPMSVGNVLQGAMQPGNQPQAMTFTVSIMIRDAGGKPFISNGGGRFDGANQALQMTADTNFHHTADNSAITATVGNNVVQVGSGAPTAANPTNYQWGIGTDPSDPLSYHRFTASSADQPADCAAFQLGGQSVEVWHLTGTPAPTLADAQQNLLASEDLYLSEGTNASEPKQYYPVQLRVHAQGATGSADVILDFGDWDNASAPTPTVATGTAHARPATGEAPADLLASGLAQAAAQGRVRPAVPIVTGHWSPTWYGVDVTVDTTSLSTSTLTSEGVALTYAAKTHSADRLRPQDGIQSYAPLVDAYSPLLSAASCNGTATMVTLSVWAWYPAISWVTPAPACS
jgi:hypothetical protein